MTLEYLLVRQLLQWRHDGAFGGLAEEGLAEYEKVHTEKSRQIKGGLGIQGHNRWRFSGTFFVSAENEPEGEFMFAYGT